MLNSLQSIFISAERDLLSLYTKLFLRRLPSAEVFSEDHFSRLLRNIIILEISSTDILNDL